VATSLQPGDLDGASTGTSFVFSILDIPLRHARMTLCTAFLSAFVFAGFTLGGVAGLGSGLFIGLIFSGAILNYGILQPTCPRCGAEGSFKRVAGEEGTGSMSGPEGTQRGEYTEFIDEVKSVVSLNHSLCVRCGHVEYD
jgi:ribosomal protein S27AE